jgi:hypothetical protein
MGGEWTETERIRRGRGYTGQVERMNGNGGQTFNKGGETILVQ